MAHAKLRLSTGGDRPEPRDFDLAGEQTNTPYTSTARRRQAPIRADLDGDDVCTAEGITAHGHAPILMLCRLLLGAGFNPDRPLEVFRGDVLALQVRSIGEGAALVVKTAGNGSPIFAPSEGAAAPPVASRAPVAISNRAHQAFPGAAP
jgi:hypothetical protein